ncbi:F-box/kelch-repeat protein [Cardamine amara subsp. amara]|uniref:F-box/kelch-repeat protein n=1 Tax=Cardamine amara subsp. amara TaxID=228776 RepID=A0ABD1C2J2_CARAN
MTKMSDLPRDLTEEVLCRLPVTSLRAARFTCKKWNTFSTNRSFTKKHIGEAKAAAKKKHKKEFQVVMVLEHKVYLCSVNLISTSIQRIGELVSLDVAYRINISKIFHCDGLLLCITNDINSRLVVWNPYCGQTRWIQPLKSYHRRDKYALGYDSCRSYKILRFIDSYDGIWRRQKRLIREFEIFDIKSNSWKVFDVTPDWTIESYHRGLSLKGNTYWFAQEKLQVPCGTVVSDIADFLLCFDFTTERFGPRLPLPSHCFIDDTVTLSSVRDEQLAVLFQRWDTLEMKIWVTTKIEPNAVSWSKFLAVDMKPLTGFQFDINAGSFLIDEKKKVAVVVDKNKAIKENRYKSTRNIAYIIGKKGYFREVDLGETTDATCYPLVCSYVPSSVQIKQASPQGNHNTP